MFLTFRRFPTTFQRFPTIVPKAWRTSPNIFPNISRRLSKTAEGSRRFPKRYRWCLFGQDGLILASLFFCEFMDLDFASVHKHAKKELGQYPAILTSHLVNNPCVLNWYDICLDDPYSKEKIRNFHWPLHVNKNFRQVLFSTQDINKSIQNIDWYLPQTTNFFINVDHPRLEHVLGHPKQATFRRSDSKRQLYENVSRDFYAHNVMVVSS